MHASTPGYGIWSLVLLNSAVFILFAFSFFRPQTRRDWSALGGLSAFLVALFVEMYGFPLTLYLLVGWLGGRYPQLRPIRHDAGHLFETLLGWKGNPHLSPLHLLANVTIALGFILLARSWTVLREAQRAGRVATTGPYAQVRHPQYLAFILIMVGFLLQWPTLLTLAMFPVLVVMYVRLAHREERELLATFGDAYAHYSARTPPFLPRLRSRPRLRPA